MSEVYRFACKCGRSYPIETRQAGQTIDCECGEKLQIPSMMKIKRLPYWDEVEGADDSEKKSNDSAKSVEKVEVQASTDAAQADSEKNGNKSRFHMSSKRFGLFIVAALVLVASVFFLCSNLRPVDPRAVFYKQTVYALDGNKKIQRDSSPITIEDYSLYYFTDFSNEKRPTYEINDDLIDAMNPFITYQYFSYVKSLPMSENFYENYDALKTRRILKIAGFAILALASLAVALVALFSKESTKQVGTMRGSDWR